MHKSFWLVLSGWWQSAQRVSKSAWEVTPCKVTPGCDMPLSNPGLNPSPPVVKIAKPKPNAATSVIPMESGVKNTLVRFITLTVA
jgi:hypothetical protein